MAKYFIILSILLISSCSLGTENNTYNLVWSEEFDYSGQPDTAKWSYDTGDGCPDLCGWGNNELQYYTNRIKNIRVQDGYLIIEAHRENYKSREYTSARILTRNKTS